ncbi:hypothetical protein C7C45_27310 [Micromonospora arborensis]|uniref:Site-specific integrase n=1 Tax=Micromonospora arborensis TaxID=2116518 RepID=A0A318NGH2_9ACTN|nr:site-specific integrase [Micromonospora arborensis]PYC65768.1 hypothetical protein C7C45_27310 [Micromonospora arborensis]
MVKALTEMTVLAETGRLSTQRVPTLAQWMETYLSEVASAKVRPSTLHRYREEVEHHIGPMLGRHRLDKLTPAHLTSFYRDRVTVLSIGSVRRMHANLRRSLNVAVRWQLIHNNPAAPVEPPSLPHVEARPYSLAEARRFLKAVEGLRLEARWLIGIALGLRQGEVLGLRWDDIDLTGLVFATAVGTPLHPRNDYRSFREIIRRAGLRQVRLHDLRHTAASVLLA